jgi:hypothetical protein
VIEENLGQLPNGSLLISPLQPPMVHKSPSLKVLRVKNPINPIGTFFMSADGFQNIWLPFMEKNTVSVNIPGS